MLGSVHLDAPTFKALCAVTRIYRGRLYGSVLYDRV